jgi:hypothetical protein
MKQLNWNTNQLQKALLVLIPLLYFIAGGYFRNLLGNLSLRSCDPEYIYFMSGLTLSDGNLKLGHIDNPGTPLQVMMALVFKLTYFFRSAPVPYVEDVLLQPDLYLSVASLFIVAATTLLLLFAGNKVYKSTNSIFYALLIQTAPFLPVIWYDLVGRVAPELIMPFPVVLLIVLIISVYFKNGKTTTKELLFFSLISALGLSIKLTFLPLWFIPFLIIDGWKKRFSFIGLSFLFFFIMAFPMTLRIEVFSRMGKKPVSTQRSVWWRRIKHHRFCFAGHQPERIVRLRKTLFLCVFQPDGSTCRLPGLFQKKGRKKNLDYCNCGNYYNCTSGGNGWETLRTPIFYSCADASALAGFSACRNH